MWFFHAKPVFAASSATVLKVIALKPVRPIPNTTVLDTAGARSPMIDQRLVYPDTEAEEPPKSDGESEIS
jgi:hypothetical protein